MAQNRTPVWGLEYWAGGSPFPLVTKTSTTGLEQWAGGSPPVGLVPIVGPLSPGAGPPSGGIAAWFSADVGVYSDAGGTVAATNGSPVALWQDRSGLGRDAYQNVAANCPSLATGVVNGLPVVRTNYPTAAYVSTLGSVNTGIGTGDFHFAAVTRGRGGSQPGINAAMGLGTVSPAFTMWNVATGQIAYWFVGSKQFTTTLGNTTTVYLVEIARVAGTLYCWVGSGGHMPTLDASTFPSTDNIVPAVLSVLYDNWGDAAAMDLAETIFYARSLSPTERTSLETYLVTKYWGAVVPPPTLSCSPGRINPGATATVTFTGTFTSWTTSPPTFTSTSPSISSIGTVTVISDTQATASVTASMTSGTATITDSSTGATTTIRITSLVRPGTFVGTLAWRRRYQRIR